MVNTNKKSGFSIAEALIAMLILSTFFVVTSKAVNIKPKQEVSENPHGFYECYINPADTTIKDQFVLNDGVIALPDKKGNDCRFIPPKSVPHVIIYNITNRKYYNSIQPQFTNEIILNGQDELDNFYQYFEEPSSGNTNLVELENFLYQNYPKSKIYEILHNQAGGANSYQGSAVFFGW